jgi:hypothetical protein
MFNGKSLAANGKRLKGKNPVFEKFFTSETISFILRRIRQFHFYTILFQLNL